MKFYLSWLKSVWTAPGNRGRRLWALASALGWFVRVRLCRSAKIVRLYGGLGFACHNDSYMAKHVHYFSEFPDYDSMHFIDGFLREGDVFLDVGANAGLYCLLAGRRVGKSGTVIAVEPQPRNLEILRENLALNPELKVELHAIAAADGVGEVRIEGGDVYAGVSREAGVVVPAMRLDACVRERLVAFAKIDVEGYEWPALRGLEETIRSGRLPVFIFEMNGCLERYGMSAGDFFTWLQAEGYTLGIYGHDSQRLNCSHSPQGDVTAFNLLGRKLIEERLPGVVITDS
jgi:FkbM family methyltransferase